MRDLFNTIASAAVTAIITVAVTAWLLTEADTPAATARLNWIAPNLPQSSEMYPMVADIGERLQNADAKAAFAAIAEKIRFEASAVVYEIVVSNNENKILNRVAIEVEDPIFATYRTEGRPNAKTAVETFVGTNRILIAEIDPQTETRVTIIGGNNFRPEKSVKVMIDNTLVPLEMERFHSEMSSEVARFVNKNLWVLLVFVIGVVAVPAITLNIVMAIFFKRTLPLRLAMAADWELRQVDEFLTYAKGKRPSAFAITPPTTEPAAP